jgi:two-component sensor histidine kinase/PAS domain-containing protein
MQLASDSRNYTGPLFQNTVLKWWLQFRRSPAVLHIARYISRRKTSEAALGAAYEELAAIHANAPVVLLTVDQDLRVERANDSAARIAGKPVIDMLGLRPGNAIGCLNAFANPKGCGYGPACGQCVIRRTLLNTVRDGVSQQNIEAWVPLFIGGQKEERCLLISTAPLEPGKNGKALLCAQDITDLKLADTKRKLAEDGLKRSFDEKVALLKEIHHRVKNNLQIVCSLLSIQANAVEHQEAANKLQDCERRVMSMAMIHQQLYNHDDVSSVDLASYGRDLVAQLYSAYSQSASMTYRMETSSTRLTIEQAIPCGLILNELVTNAFKYAYPDGRGEIVIQLSSEDDYVCIAVSDHGVGMPADFNCKASKSLGMMLVDVLTKQLNGRLEIGAPPGASFTVRFTKRTENVEASAASV